MIMDNFTEFCDATSVAAIAGTALLGDVIDLTTARDVGGSKLFFVMTVDTAIITGGTAGTIQFQLVSDAQAAIAVDGSATVHWTSKSFVTDDAALNDLDAGDIICQIELPIEADGTVYERYLGVIATIGTTTVTAGKVNAFLTKDPMVHKSYANASN